MTSDSRPHSNTDTQTFTMHALSCDSLTLALCQGVVSCSVPVSTCTTLRFRRPRPHNFVSATSIRLSLYLSIWLSPCQRAPLPFAGTLVLYRYITSPRWAHIRRSTVPRRARSPDGRTSSISTFASSSSRSRSSCRSSRRSS